MATQPPGSSIRTAVLHGNDRGQEYWAQVTEDEMYLKDLTSNDVNAQRHGFVPKLSGNPGDFLNGQGLWIPAGAVITGTFTVTGTGFTVPPTATATWVKIGPLKILYIPLLSGTSNATTFTITSTAMPTDILPAISNAWVYPAVDNGVPTGCYVLFDAGLSTIRLNLITASGNWTPSGTKTFGLATIVY